MGIGTRSLGGHLEMLSVFSKCLSHFCSTESVIQVSLFILFSDGNSYVTLSLSLCTVALQ